ncbi:MAG: 4a-hydroxytetrahydrobiopterin dehydratase [Bryobacterales bacterium]|nr:4a-hydroxytetrahydrobiopterin dehydratase [Bryobacterales bacterium]
MPQKLSDAELSTGLETLPGWELRNGKLHREYRFADFTFAFGFMATCATHIEKVNHHPEWLNVWNRVTVDLMTHDAGGITNKDMELALFLETVAARFV